MGLIFAIIFGFTAFLMLRDIEFFSYSYFFNEGKREIKIWLPYKMVQSIIDGFKILIWLSFLSTFITLLNEYWSIAIISLIISIVGITYFRIRSNYQSHLIWSISTIENIDESSFEIHQIENGKIKSIEKILWEDIAKASLRKDELRLYTRDGQRMFISPKTKHFYTLIRQIPKNFTNITFRQVNAHFKDLKPCLICGSVAANGYHCLSCETPVWRKQFSKYYENKRDYVKAKQLDLFASLQKNSQQALTFSRDETFDLHKHWKLLVSEEDIKKYSQKNWWIL